MRTYKLSLFLSFLLIGAVGAAEQPTADAPPIPRPAPALVGPDADGKPRDLKDFHGQAVAVYFFCGCSRCQAVSRLWSQLQRSTPVLSDPYPPEGERAPARTMVVFHGEAGMVKQFAERQGIVTSVTTLMPDLNRRLHRAYQVTQCPRAFVIDPEGQIRFTTQPDGQKADPTVLVRQTLDALTAATKPVNAAKPEPKK